MRLCMTANHQVTERALSEYLVTKIYLHINATLR